MASPYRSTALAVLPTHREVVRCGWCAWYRGDYYSTCDGPPAGGGKRAELNRDGDCDLYRDSFTTRLLRRFGLRSPALVRVTERDAEPDSASPRNGGAVGRGGDVGGGHRPRPTSAPKSPPQGSRAVPRKRLHGDDVPSPGPGPDPRPGL